MRTAKHGKAKDQSISYRATREHVDEIEALKKQLGVKTRSEAIEEAVKIARQQLSSRKSPFEIGMEILAELPEADTPADLTSNPRKYIGEYLNKKHAQHLPPEDQ